MNTSVKSRCFVKCYQTDLKVQVEHVAMTVDVAWFNAYIMKTLSHSQIVF